MNEEVYILDTLRTPVGKYGGGLSTIRPDDLAALVLEALLKRNPNLPIDQFEDVVLGCANQAGEDNRNVARMALLMAGFPIETGGITVNRLCASGMQAIMDASRAIMNGDGSLYVAGGTESMSRAPFVMAKAAEPFSRSAEIYDTTLGWRFVNSKLSALYHPYSMGETAENVAEKWNISRTEQDEFAYQSQQKYIAAQANGIFENELIAVTITDRKGQKTQVNTDEHPRATTIEKLNSLAPAFRSSGTVTAGNSSGINDGAAAMILASKKKMEEYGYKPLAKIKSMAIAGVAPEIMGIGPIPASLKALKRAGLTMSDIGLVELNEAFASQSLACIKELRIDPSIVNVNGGAIALGHPLGASGTRITGHLALEMKRRGVRYGLATMCIGVGQGAAMILENTD